MIEKHPIHERKHLMLNHINIAINKGIGKYIDYFFSCNCREKEKAMKNACNVSWMTKN